MGHKFPATLGSALLLAVLIGAGPTAADPITGTENDDVLTGTPRRDTIRGLAGNDDITGGKGPDRVFGGKGNDTAYWVNRDGQDQIDGGADEDTLHIATLAEPLRLHLDALDAGPLVKARDDLQAIGVRGLEAIVITATAGDDRLVLSSDRGILRGFPLGIELGGGNDRLDLRDMRVATATFPGAGNDWLRLGKEPDAVEYSASNGHDTIIGFAEEDLIVLLDPNAFQTLDTNSDGRIDRRDSTVTIRNGSMTVDLAPVLDEPPGPTSITFVNRTSLSLSNFRFVAG